MGEDAEYHKDVADDGDEDAQGKGDDGQDGFPFWHGPLDAEARVVHLGFGEAVAVFVSHLRRGLSKGVSEIK